MYMHFLKTHYFFVSLMVFVGCTSSNNENKDPNDTKESSTINVEAVDSLEKESQHIEDIYLNVPSPMVSAIILDNAGAVYDYNLPLAPNIGHKYQTSDEQAIILGVYGTDLNYSVVSDETMETELYFKSINLLGEKLGLNNILNEDIKSRVDNNIHRIDSMQVIISTLFWEVESTLKENERNDISALVVAGGWIEGLYIASQLSLQIPNNKSVTDLICKQKYSMESLISLLNSNEYSDHINEKLLNPLNNLKLIFDEIKETVNSEEADINIQSINDNIQLSYDQITIDQIRNSIQQIREDIIH